MDAAAGRGGHGDHVRTGGRILDGVAGEARVPRGGGHDHALDVVGVGDGGGHRRVVVGRAQRQVDDAGTVVGGPQDSPGDVGRPARTVGAEPLDGQDSCPGGEAGHAHVVVGDGGDDARHVGAVAVVVGVPVAR